MKYEARQRGYKVLGMFRPDEVLPFTSSDVGKHGFMCDDGKIRQVKMTSLRYQTFKRNLRCACCGIEGAVFLLELPKDMDVPHFNLYAKREGKLVQMTKDHIRPKSNKGSDHINNIQTMCHRCNELKGSKKLKLKRLREIQDGVQVVYTVLNHGGIPMEGFATSEQGIMEIMRKYVMESYQWEDGNFQVQASIRRGIVMVQHGGGSPHTFTIKPIRRI